MRLKELREFSIGTIAFWFVVEEEDGTTSVEAMSIEKKENRDQESDWKTKKLEKKWKIQASINGVLSTYNCNTCLINLQWYNSFYTSCKHRLQQEAKPVTNSIT